MLYPITYSSPLGTIVIESDGECLTGLRFVEAERCPDETGKAASAQKGNHPINSEAIQWLDDYFAGKQPRNIPRIDSLGTDFQRKVWQALFTIDYGQTKTYGEIAKIVDCRSAQAVGQAISRNPIALIIPCHRVICADGTIGGYAYGIARKEQLLQMEKMNARKTIEVVAAIIRDEESRIFATQRGYGEWKDWWEFPGGKIEAGESREQALQREIREELAAEIEVGKLLRTIDYDYPAFHLTMHCFFCRLKGNVTLLEHEAAKWLAPTELLSVRWLPADKDFIKDLTIHVIQ